MIRSGAAAVAAAGGLAGLGYYLVVSGKLTIDTGWGRRVRPLGPFGARLRPRQPTVFEVIAGPYLGRTPRAMSGKLQVLQRGSDMVLAEHYTPVHHGRLTAATLETITFERPNRIAFWLVRGPARTSPRNSPSPGTAARPGWSIPANSAPTSPPRASGGPAASPPPGKRRSVPLSPASRPKQNATPDRHPIS
jgi:hypothetical protein